MPKFEKHIFVCGNQRPPGNPRGCCDPTAGAQLQKTSSRSFAQRGLKDSDRPGTRGRGRCIASYPSKTVAAAFFPEVWRLWVERPRALPAAVASVPLLVAVPAGPAGDIGRASAVAPQRHVASARLATHEAIHRTPVPPLFGAHGGAIGHLSRILKHPEMPFFSDDQTHKSIGQPSSGRPKRLERAFSLTENAIWRVEP